MLPSDNKDIINIVDLREAKRTSGNNDIEV
jgi:hypothetical protein